MPDIRLVHARSNRLWLWSGLLALIAIAVWAWGTFGYDPTAEGERPQIGEALNFGAERAPVLPIFPMPFDSVAPLSAHDIGTYVQLRGSALSAVRRDAVWVRSNDGRRILVRFEPSPPENAIAHIRSGGAVNLSGYVERVALAEFNLWMDTLGVRIPRPRPGAKFGDLPDPEFARVDALFVRDFYVSVRPEGTRGPQLGENED
jgi:hypothetical protein